MNRKLRVIVAEDSPTQQLQIEAYLTDNGFEVELAANGREALDKVHENRPDVVVTDLEMPEMNGLELVSALQAEYRDLPVVLITARGSEKIASAALQAGAASYVPKQELENNLASTLKRILDVIASDQSEEERLPRYLAHTESEWSVENDTSLVPEIVSRFLSELARVELADENQMMQISVAIDEALVNAIIHGNLEVSSKLRDIDNGKPYASQIEERRSQEPYNQRQVVVKIHASREKCTFTIRDQGPGFNPGDIPDPTDPANLEKVSGRGLLLINAFMDEVTHNASGNEITMSLCKKKSGDSGSE